MRSKSSSWILARVLQSSYLVLFDSRFFSLLNIWKQKFLRVWFHQFKSQQRPPLLLPCCTPSQVVLATHLAAGTPVSFKLKVCFFGKVGAKFTPSAALEAASFWRGSVKTMWHTYSKSLHTRSILAASSISKLHIGATILFLPGAPLWASSWNKLLSETSHVFKIERLTTNNNCALHPF